MKVYVVTGFKKDKATGASLPCMLEVFKTRKSAEKFASAFDGFTTVTTKAVNK